MAIAALAAPAAPASPVRGTATGKVIAVDGSSFSIQTPGRGVGVVPALIATANRIAAHNYPYVYGGGHPHAGQANIGIPGPGYDGHTIGFDCSGAVGAVLAGAGLWPALSGVPRDDGIITQLRAEGKIAPGVGRGPVEVTLYDYPAVHIFMNINGRFFGTSDGGGTDGGGEWLNDGAPDASSPHFHAYHLLPSALRSSRSGEVFTFAANGLDGLTVGDQVKVRYREGKWGTLLATRLSYLNLKTAAGRVTAIADDGSSFTLTRADGSSLTFSVPSGSGLLDHVAVGDSVKVKYTQHRSTLTAHQLTVTATPAPAPGPAPPPTPGPAPAPAPGPGGP